MCSQFGLVSFQKAFERGRQKCALLVYERGKRTDVVCQNFGQKHRNTILEVKVASLSNGIEEMFSSVSPNERRSLFTKLFYFVMKSDIRYKTFIFEKRQFENVLKLEGRMAKEISQFIRGNQEFFQSFESVVLYYDNGQHELNRILNTVLATELSQYDVRKVLPKDYKLFQAADLICTLQLLSLKCDRHELSRSEQLIFHNERELKKTVLETH